MKTKKPYKLEMPFCCKDCSKCGINNAKYRISVIGRMSGLRTLKEYCNARLYKN